MGCPQLDRTKAWIDGDSRDSEIEAHVATCETCGELARGRGLGMRATVLDTDAKEVPHGETAPQPDACFAVGAMVGGRYRITRFIARGGMGEVYEAFDAELRVKVALKAATRTTGIALERFRREVTLARRVTHRNVCRLFEIGFETMPDGDVPYCTMELLEGDTLSDRLARGPLAIDHARSIVEQVAAGLTAAHEVGVIHRDFKSNNIMLVGDRAVISDFGLARSEPGVADDRSTLTHEQALIGTPAYMAPEQVESKPVSAATDIYALGIVMFEMVTGELPFRGSTSMETAVMRLKQTAPSARGKRGEVPVAWDKAIAKCLEIDPAKRFARASDVAFALGAAPRRKRWPIAAAIAVLGVGATAAVMLASPAPEAPAALPATAADGSRTVLVIDPGPAGGGWRATAVGELLRNELRVPGRVRVVDGDEVSRLLREIGVQPGDAPSRDAIARLGAASPAQLAVTGTLRDMSLEVRWIDLATGREVGAARIGIDGGDLSAATGELGARLRQTLAGDVPADADRAVKALPDTVEAARAYAEGLARIRALDHGGAIAQLSRATELAPDFAPAYLALYGELATRRLNAKAQAAAKRAFELAGRLRSDQRLRAEASYRTSRREWPQAADLWATLLATSPDDVAVATTYAATLGFDGQHERCFAVLDQMRRRPPPVGDDPRIDLREAACARSSGDFRRGLAAATRADVKASVRGAIDVQAAALALEGETLATAGEYDRALVVLHHAVELDRKIGDGEGVLEAQRQLAFVRSEQGDNRDAERIDREALALARSLGDRVGEGIVLNDLGQVLPKAGDALAMFQDGLAIAREQGDNRLVTVLLLNIANKQDALGRTAEAIETYREVIARAKDEQDDQNLATATMNMADSLSKLGRDAEALPLYDSVLASYQKRGDEDGVGFALESRGELRWGDGDLAGARADLEAALALRVKLGEKANAAKSQDRLARLDLAEERTAEAESLARASLAERRTETEPDKVAESLVTLARVLAMLGKGRDAVAAIDEAEHLVKPDPDGTVHPREAAFIRALADPANADAQLAIIRADATRAGCASCPSETRLEEAEVERAAGHTAHARQLLAEAQRLARAAKLGDIAARATLLLERTR
jgi:tetratricopeptide (TPR) repeat protein/tRNA A-37 threonylcarbamoyl transferase component Bud32